MRKVLMLLTLTVSYFAAFGSMNAETPPACNPCPWVR
jgi:hypothetical protein